MATHTRPLHTLDPRHPQPQFQRDAIKRQLNRMGIDHRAAARRVNVDAAKLSKWFDGGPVLSREQVDRLVAIVNPKGKHGRRRQLAEAADFWILRRIKKEPKASHVIRIVELLRLLRKAEELRLHLFNYVADIDCLMEYHSNNFSFADPDPQALNLEFQATLRMIEEHLKRYRWTPRLLCPDFHSLSQRYIWPKEEPEYSENWAVSWLLWQAQDGAQRAPASILNFRQCQQCGTLFYALADHAKCCSATCRKKFHPQSPDDRAAYMRQYRRNLKEKEHREDEADRLANRRVGSKEHRP